MAGKRLLMKLKSTALVPSTTREPFFDGANLDSGCYSLKCAQCNAEIEVSCHSIYLGAWEWKENFSKNDKEAIEDFFSIQEKSLALTGGWPSVTLQKCRSCSSEFIFLADFHEYRNSVYQIVAQGAAYVEN